MRNKLLTKKIVANIKSGLLIYPFLFAIYPILFLWSTNILELSVFSTRSDLLIPIAIVEMMTVLLLVVSWIVVRNWRIAGVIVTFAILLFFSYGVMLEAVADHVDIDYAKNRYMVFVWLAVFTVGTALLFFFRAKLTILTNPLNCMALILIAFTLPNFISYSPPTPVPMSEQFARSSTTGKSGAVETGTLPDIWYITAEGYSSARILKDNLNYDNTPFIHYLERNGFYVASESNSNYHSTQNSLASSFNMQFLQQMIASDSDFIEQYGLYPMISDNRAMRFARQYGYEVVYLADRFPGGRTELGDTYYGCGSRRLGIHREGFVDALLMTTALNPVMVQFGLLEPTLNELRVCDFFQLAKAKDLPGPKIISIHLKVPGHPFVVGPNGEVFTSTDTTGFYDQSFLDQLTWTNKELERLFDVLLSDSDYSPVIVLQGDHGEPTAINTEIGEDGLQGDFGIMNAYHLPDGGSSLLYPSISPVNTFRVIFNYYLNGDFELLEDASYYQDSARNVVHVQWTDVTEVVSRGFDD